MHAGKYNDKQGSLAGCQNHWVETFQADEGEAAGDSRIVANLTRNREVTGGAAKEVSA